MHLHESAFRTTPSQLENVSKQEASRTPVIEGELCRRQGNRFLKLDVYTPWGRLECIGSNQRLLSPQRIAEAINEW
tara:strand:- start:74 stop:301 length:228 start_codon:yes stop_codon:yes gene_type:complete